MSSRPSTLESAGCEFRSGELADVCFGSKADITFRSDEGPFVPIADIRLRQDDFIDDRLELVCSVRVCLSDLIVMRCAASHTHTDGFDRTTVRDPNTRAALLTFAVE